MTEAKEKDIGIGSKERFAVRFAFQRDPDQGRGATAEEYLSWGALEIWAAGKNLCKHLDSSQPVASVHWYLLPLLEWFARNWDFLLHEERLPVPATAPDAWRALEDFPRPPANLDDVEASAWEERWQRWWNRHALVSCRQGGLIPSVVFRRWREEIEISWGDERLAGCPDYFRFDLQPGFVRLEPQEVAEVLYESLRDAARHLQEQMPESPRLNKLVDAIRDLKTADHRRRLGLLSGAVAENAPEQHWDRIESFFSRAGHPKIAGHTKIIEELLGTNGEALVLPGDRQAVLMFGTLSPTISDADARLLAKKLVTLYSSQGDRSKLVDESRNMPLESADQRAWKQGYDLAEEFLEALRLPKDRQQWIDVEALYEELEISVQEIALDDAAIRAVAIAGPHHKPTVLINSNQRFQEDAERRRFTLAHELCHLLYDRSYGARLAIASGPWALIDVEQRANAFAAMLLMPRTLMASAVRSLTVLSEEESVREVARRLRTSFTATLDHLYNLGFLDSEARDYIRTRLESRATAAPTRTS